MKRLSVILIVCGLIITAVPCFSDGSDLSQVIIYDIPDEKMLDEFGRIPVSQLTYQDSIEIASYRFTADTVRLLAILIDWSNRPATYSKETIDSLLFSRGVFPGGSVADYYNEVSYGQTTIVGDVTDWYNAGTYRGFPNFEGVMYALDPVIDYSQYDGNHDGDVDALVFVRSGNGEEDSQDPYDIWSFAMAYGQGSGPGPFDGVYISHWNSSPETRPLHAPWDPRQFLGIDTLNGIRVFAHELGHNLGLPDLYDYDSKLDTATYTIPNDDNDHPIVDWGIMGYYGYGLLSIGSVVPSHFCGWSRMQLGWIEPIIIQDTMSHIILYDIESHKDSSLYAIRIDPRKGEYFLLEYRNPGSTAQFDKLDSDFSVYLHQHLTFGADTLDRGLLITHVHDSVGFSNGGTPRYPHYKVVVEDAGYDPSQDASTNPEGHVTDSAQWWYPYETRRAALFSDMVPGQELFGPDTYPNSDGYEGPTGILVRVDSIVGDRLYAYVENPPVVADADDDGVTNFIDNCPLVSNPAQSDLDFDGMGDVCDNCTDLDGDGFGRPGLASTDCEIDNCPDVYNPDQSDVNNDDVGDACCCVGLAGNVDCDFIDSVDLGDLTRMIDYLFISFAALCCPEEANIDGDTGGLVDLGDLRALIDYLFISFTPPTECL